MQTVMPPWLPVIVEFLEAVFQFFTVIAPIAGGFASIILAILYYYQFNTLDEQTKISKMSQVPHLTGPYNFSYNSEEDVIDMYITNAGDGLAKEVEFWTYLSIDDNFDGELEGGKTEAYFSRDDGGFVEENEVQPRESDVRFILNPDDISVKIKDCSVDGTPEERIYPIQDAAAILHYYGIDFIQIHTYVKYTDRFGNEEDPFGREYVIRGRNPAMETMSTDIRAAFRRSLASEYIKR